MNIVLFESSEIADPLPINDARARHILRVLRRTEGDDFDVGTIDGPRGKATVTKIGPDNLELQFSWSPPHAASSGPHLAIGFPRPQTARDILRDATSLGVGALNFISTARSDPNYATSSLWTSGEWRRQAITGAAQAFDTHLPKIRWQHSLTELLSCWRERGIRSFALDLYDTAGHLPSQEIGNDLSKMGILIGPERGWAAADRRVLDDFDIARYDLGPRVQRTEIAVAITLGTINAGATRA